MKGLKKEVVAQKKSRKKLRKVLLLGSGAIRIGQAGEFDYSGSQAIKALKEEGLKVVLVNPNVATIQTSEHLADKVYFVPIEPHFVEEVIKKEKPQGILLAFGGQTALNCGVELENSGVLKKYGVRVLGTPVRSIEETEDRDLFVKKLHEVGLKSPKGVAVNSVKEALRVAEKIGYPVMARVAYALGGLGSGVSHTPQGLKKLAEKAFAKAPQILVEEYLGGWKEVEYEVVRDAHDNCITVCNMENFDPMGIHTGESIVVAPSQTLSNSEYHKLRDIAIKVVRHLGIVGECNIQYALDPHSEDYRIIEVNARLSRSSALASKATGYPLAFVAAKLALGYSLVELENKVTRVTKSCFEPALDYIVVKVPRWDLQKFVQVNKTIGSEMKSVGEIMAIGRTFEEAFQKSIRMLGVGLPGLACTRLQFDDLKKELRYPTDKRAYAVCEALHQGMTIEEVHELSKIDRWFLQRIQRIVDCMKGIESSTSKMVSSKLIFEAKRLGFSDEQLARLMNTTEPYIRKFRQRTDIHPVVKQIDTLAGEYPAKTNYLYLTYNGTEDDIEFKEKKKVIVLGGGAYRIGSSVEFDWCCVNAVRSLHDMGHTTIMINCNPETVSTDYDECDKLYFEELTFETLHEIYLKENPDGVILSMGGQIPNNLALPCQKATFTVLGTDPRDVDRAEDRYKFSRLLEKEGIDQPAWKELQSIGQAKAFANSIGYPVLIRPSYVLSGSAMNVAFDDKELEECLQKAVDVSEDHPVVVSQFVLGAKELEIDAVAKDGKVIVWALSEHVENAGVHSGDATIVFPAQRLYLETVRRVKKITQQIAEKLKITGPFNIQFLAKDNTVLVIECNLRASRSFPFVSKVSKVNFISLATKAIMNKRLKKSYVLDLDYVGVKAPQFSFSRLKGADPLLGVEMASTGEVACFGEDLHEAFLKAILATGFRLPDKNVLVSVSGEKQRYRFLGTAVGLCDMGYTIFATENTSLFLKKHGIPSKMVYKIHEKKEPNISSLLQKRKVDLSIILAEKLDKTELKDEYQLRRYSVDFAVPLITNLQLAKLFVEALLDKKLEDLKVVPWQGYVNE